MRKYSCPEMCQPLLQKMLLNRWMLPSSTQRLQLFTASMAAATATATAATATAATATAATAATATAATALCRQALQTEKCPFSQSHDRTRSLF